MPRWPSCVAPYRQRKLRATTAVHRCNAANVYQTGHVRVRVLRRVTKPGSSAFSSTVASKRLQQVHRPRRKRQRRPRLCVPLFTVDIRFWVVGFPFVRAGITEDAAPRRRQGSPLP